MRQIKNVRALRQALASGQREFRIYLSGGVFSRKYITPCIDGRFEIINYIDDSTQQLTAKQLHTESNIGKAMKMHAFTTE
jgi:hypothetical protein